MNDNKSETSSDNNQLGWPILWVFREERLIEHYLSPPHEGVFGGEWPSSKLSMKELTVLTLNIILLDYEGLIRAHTLRVFHSLDTCLVQC